MPDRSLTKAEHKAREAPLVAGEGPIDWGSTIVEDVVVLQMGCGVKRKNANANLAPLRAVQEWQMQHDVPVDFCVQREIHWKAQTVRRRRIILKNVQWGIRKSRMHVRDRTQDQLPP